MHSGALSRGRAGRSSPLFFANPLLPLKTNEIYSKAWCDLIFSGRNKAYGAYRLRRSQGRRYAAALAATVLFALAAFVAPAGFALAMRLLFFADLKDAAQEVKQLKRFQREQDYELKHISAGRGRPQVSTTKDAVAQQTPEVVDFVVVPPRVVGRPGPETVVVDENLLAADRDTLHNRDRQDLPEEGVQLSAVDVVREMPQFPGGITGLMKWLDETIVFPNRLRDQKIHGTLEVTFFVEADGSVREARISKPLHPELDRIALEAILRMPLWKPGRTISGRPSAVCITLPIEYAL